MATQQELEKMTREEYLQEYFERGKRIWDCASIPTVADIAAAVADGECTPGMQYMFDFFDNEEKFMKQAKRTNSHYTEDESSTYISSVISANVSDISESGYLYKMLMASGDDMRIIGHDCGSSGTCIQLPADESTYIYEIKGSWVKEWGGHMLLSWEDFDRWQKGITFDCLHVRTPLTCNYASERRFCAKCAGHIPEGIENIGAYNTLCITEFATQAALSSMNNGKQDNVNTILKMNPGLKAVSWSEVQQVVADICEKLRGDAVERRFYEIALLSRVHESSKGAEHTYDMVSLGTSIRYTPNKFGAYLFSHSMDNFKRMVQQGMFDDNSLKVQIALNQYNALQEQVQK